MSDEEIKQQQNDQFIRLLHLSDKLFLSIIVSAIAISSTVVWQGSKIYSKIEADEVSIVELNDDKKIKMDELNAERTKKFKDIPLTDDQVKAVDATLLEIRKNMMQGGGPRPGGGK